MRVQPTAVPLRPLPNRAAGLTGADRVRRQIAHCDAVADHFDPDRLAAFLDGPAPSLSAATDALFTLTSWIEDVAAVAELSPRPHRSAAMVRIGGAAGVCGAGQTGSGE